MLSEDKAIQIAGQFLRDIEGPKKGDPMMALYDAFKKVEAECLRWIPVNERLPEEDEKVIILSRHPLPHEYLLSYFGYRQTILDEPLTIAWMLMPPAPEVEP